MKLIRIEGKPNLAKDEESGAIVNTDEHEIEQAKELKEKRKEKEEEFAQLKNDVSELKDMMKTIIEKMSKEDNG